MCQYYFSLSVPLLALLLLSLPPPECTQNGEDGGETRYNTGDRADAGSTPPPSRRSGWEWMPRDAFDEFIAEFDNVTADNCKDQLNARMRSDTLQAVTVFNDLIPVWDVSHIHCIELKAPMGLCIVCSLVE
jgi:hypothetical protein